MTGRRGHGVTGWLGVVLLLVGLPAVLIRFVGWPLPHHWPTRAQWELWLQDPLADRRTLLDLFAIAVWLGWAVLAYAFLADLAARLRRASRRLWRLGRRLRPLPSARGVLGAAVVGTGTAVVSVVATAHPPAPATAATPPAPDTSPPPASPGPTAPTDDQPATAADRVALPGGGWVTRHTAAAVAASGAMVWHQRRRHYQPRPLAGVDRNDLDLAPLPPTADAIIQQLQPPPEQPPIPTEPAEAAPTLQTAPESTEAVVGERAGQPLPLSALPPGGIGLAGGTALDAARGILIAALLSRAESQPQPAVVTTRADLAVLLDTSDLPEAVPGLLVAGDVTEAIAAVEDVALARADPTTNRPDATDESRTVLVTASPSDPRTARQVRVLLRLAADKGIRGVLLGRWQPDATWQIGPDGVIDSESPARLSVLGAAATSDLLALYRQAQTSRPEPGARRHRGSAAVDGVRAGRVPRQIPAAGVLPTGVSPAPASRVGAVRLTVLGPPAVYRPGETEPVRWPRSAALPVLVYLALSPAGATSAALAAVLWPQLHPNSTTNRIYNIMTVVRNNLDDAAGGPTIVRDGDRYRLNPQRVDVDLWRLHDAIRVASASPEPIVRATALRRVVDAYTGELADGWPWPWLYTHREATRRHVLDAYTTLASDEPAAVALLLHEAAAADPGNE